MRYDPNMVKNVKNPHVEAKDTRIKSNFTLLPAIRTEKVVLPMTRRATVKRLTVEIDELLGFSEAHQIQEERKVSEVSSESSRGGEKEEESKVSS